MRRREEGFAVVVALGVLTICLLLGSAAVLSATAANDTSNRDRATKKAIQAADAGLQAAIFRMNRLNVVRSALPCVGLDLSLLPLDASTGWCSPVGETLGDGESYSYAVSPVTQVSGSQVTLDRTIVVTGTARGVTRRVAATASALRGTPLFGPSTVVSLRDLALANSARIGAAGETANVRSNGSISLSNSSTVCGNVTPGPGRSVTTVNSSSVCAGFSTAPASSPLVLPPVDQGNTATVNDNARICAADPCSRANSTTWNATTKRLSIANQQTVTLGGSVYSFCQLDLANRATLQIAPRAAGTSVRIYIESPDSPACAGSTGGITKVSNSQVVNPNPDATQLQFYVVGSPTRATTVSFANLTRSAPMTIYAPTSTVSLANNAVFRGAIASLQLSMANNTQILPDASTSALETSTVLPIYRAGQYRECRPRAPVANDPKSGC